MNTTHPPTTAPSKSINWLKSAAKLIIISDIKEGVLPSHLTAQEAWESCYMHIGAFRNVPYNQFRDRLRDHRRQNQKDTVRAAEEEIALEHDRRLFPRETHNLRGEPVFDMSYAKLLLREDVHNKIHLTMNPSDFHNSRPKYILFKSGIFRDRLHQEIRRKKFLFHLELQRTQGKKNIRSEHFVLE
jgi:hypothetical protein